MCAEDYIANRLVDLCEKRGLTKYRLAQLTGMSQTAIGSIISKESIPTIPNVTKLRLLYDKNIIKKVGEIVSSAFFAFQGQHK